MIDKKKKLLLEKKMEAAGIFEADIEEKFVLGSGKGGQKVNKTNSTVSLRHIPTGICVKCGKDRLREANRFFARRRLLEKILEKENFEESKKNKEIAKIRKQKARRSKKTKEKMLKDKHLRSSVKANRSKPNEDH